MSKTETQSTNAAQESVYEAYVLGVRIVEEESENGDVRYQFEADGHRGRTFDDAEMATLYADIYFCTNGFEEEGTGERGVPPEVIGAGRAVLASYFLTQPSIDEDWVASFFGKKPHFVRQYTESVRRSARQIRDGAEARGLN